MNDEPNLLGNVSLGAAILLVVLYVIGMCVGLIPFVGILAIFLLPVEGILAVVAIATGALGYQRSKDLDGAGAMPSLFGAGVASAWLLLQVLGMCAIFGIGGLAVLGNMLG